MKKAGQIDYILLTIILLMLAFGTIMITSASGYTALRESGDPYAYLKKQIMFLVIGGIAMFVLSFLNFNIYKKFAIPILIVAFILMLAVMLPGLGYASKGARRWINLGFTTFQPSELMKYAVVIFFAAYLTRKSVNPQKFFKTIWPLVAILGGVGVLMYIQPHLSGLIVIAVGGILVIFLSGIKLLPFAIGGGVAAAGAVVMAFAEPYRVARMFTFLAPFQDKQGDAWQISNALYGIGSGGLTGVGLGRSVMKFLYIPEPHNDFIMAIIAEELGFIGVLFVFALFTFFIIRGCRIALKAPTKFSALVAAGVTGIIAFQAIVNLGVVSASLPVTGMPLPFFSYGGSSLVVLMGAVGILLNISRYTKTSMKELEEVSDESTDSRRGNSGTY